MLRKKMNGDAKSVRLSSALQVQAHGAVDRRTFLRNSGLAIGGLAAVSAVAGRVQKAEAAGAAAGGKVDIKKTVCTHCSVGCTIMAEVQNGVWIGQEPGFDSPFNLGAHCAKGAAAREHAHGDRRLKYPMKLVAGKWTRIGWDVAINEIGDKMLQIRQTSGQDSVYWMGSAKHSNEQAYLFRKFAAFWGTNNVDHQARICHSTTVAGVANTWGYGAMPNSYNDIMKTKAMFLIGGNPAEAHPVSLQHLLKAKEQNNAAFIVCDPRFTRTAAHATEYVRFRSGTDIALVWGLLWHIFENGWEDKEYIRKRVWGMDFVREEVKNWTPEEVENVTGVPGAQMRRVAQTLASSKPATVIWCMGGTQHTVGNANVRAYCILQLALGNVGVAGGGTNIFRGHDNVQGATDFGVEPITLPGYYGLIEGAWKHWARVWDVPYDWVLGRFKDKKLMEAAGIPLSRWADGVLETKENVEQPDTLKAMVFWGHAPNSQTRGPDLKKAFEKLYLLVVIDPHPTVSAVLHDRTDGVYLLPAATQYETVGSVTASNRSLQWREKVFGPFFEAKSDHEIMYLFAKKFGFEKELFKNIKVEGNEPVAEGVLNFRVNFGLTVKGQANDKWAKNDPVADSLLAVESYPVGNEIKDGHPPVSMGMLMKMGWDKDLTPEELAVIQKIGGDKPENVLWTVDMSGGIQRVAIKHGVAPFGNGKARCVVWNFPDGVPLHREPLYTNRRDLLPKYATHSDRKLNRLPLLFESIQKRDVAKEYPIILTSGRLVEYEGGGEEQRSNPWLAELQQNMFVEMNPADANNLGVKDGQQVWVEGPEKGKAKVMAMVTERVGKGVAFMPFHFGGHFQGKDLRSKYPAGADPIVLGESANTVTTYGYDVVTQMQETKTTLCKIWRA